MWLLKRMPALSLLYALSRGKALNTRTRALSSVSKGDDLEEDVDRKTAWLLKGFLGATALYVGCQFVPLMGDSMIQQSVALLRVKDPLFKRMGASRLSRIAMDGCWLSFQHDVFVILSLLLTILFGDVCNTQLVIFLLLQAIILSYVLLA